MIQLVLLDIQIKEHKIRPKRSLKCVMIAQKNSESNKKKWAFRKWRVISLRRRRRNKNRLKRHVKDLVML